MHFTHTFAAPMHSYIAPSCPGWYNVEQAIFPALVATSYYFWHACTHVDSMHRARGPPSSHDRWRTKQVELALFPSPLDSEGLELRIQVIVENRVFQHSNTPVRRKLALGVVSRMLPPSFAHATFAQRHVDVS